MKVWPLNLALKTPRLHAEGLYLGSGLGALVTATAAEANDLADGIPALGYCVYRARNTAAAITAGTAVALAAKTGYQFIVKDAWMRAIGGAVAGPTTVEIAIETTGTVMLSHVVADLTEDAWRGPADGTHVITGITAGGLVTVSKKLLITDSGGSAFATATHLDTIVAGYWATV